MITIYHSGDSTTVEGTTRDDAATIKAVGGFKWSRNLNAWYLPRTWHEVTRKQRVDQLARALGDRCTVEVGDLAKSASADERAEAHKARAAELAERHASRADRLEASAGEFLARSDAETAGIPFGQPILVGHHSQRRHEKALDKSWALLGKSVEASKEARLEASRAVSSAREADGYDQPARVGRRLVAARAELGRWTRSLKETSDLDSEWAKRARVAIADLEAKIARDERVLAESPAAGFNRDTVTVGDLVKIRGKWSIVDKANPTKVVITSHGLTLDYLYAEIQDHKRPTGDQLRKVIESRHTSDLQASLRSRRLPAATREVIAEVLAGRVESAV